MNSIRSCDPDIFPFKTTNDLPDFKETIGQERGLHSLDFGLSLESTGFNIFPSRRTWYRKNDYGKVVPVSEGL